MQIMVDNSTSNTQLRALSRLFLELAGDEPETIELTPAIQVGCAQPNQYATTAEIPGIKNGVVSADFIAEVAQGYPELTPMTAPALPPVTAPVAPITVDVTGRKWDERIDSSSKALIADGTWRRRKGISDEVYKAVLSAAKVDVVPLIPLPPPVTAAVVPTPPPPANPVTVATFPALMAWAAPYLGAGRLTSDRLNEACRTVDQSLQNLQHLIQRQEHVPAVYAVLQGYVA